MKYGMKSKDAFQRNRLQSARGKSIMNRVELLSLISIDPNVCFGKPCVRGHRLWVSLILDFLVSGMTIEEILKNILG